jgi:hypothetical protein
MDNTTTGTMDKDHTLDADTADGAFSEHGYSQYYNKHQKTVPK